MDTIQWCECRCFFCNRSLGKLQCVSSWLCTFLSETAQADVQCGKIVGNLQIWKLAKLQTCGPADGPTDGPADDMCVK